MNKYLYMRIYDVNAINIPVLRISTGNLFKINGHIQR